MTLLLSVIIVNYRSSKDIICCLLSAMEFPSYTQFEWIIVDNNSGDDSKEQINGKFPFVKWVDMGYNAGFARANNLGIRHSKCETLLLLNPDTIILDDAIFKCYERLVKSDCIAASVQLLNADHTPQITGNFFMKGGLNHLLPLPYLGKLLRSIAFAIKVKKTNVQQSSSLEEVDWINGAFMMVRKKSADEAGYFDEDFFLYAEEIEWCSRLSKTGKIVVYGDLFTIHLQGETINKETNSPDKGYTNLYDKKGLQLIVSQMVRIRKQFGITCFLFHLFVYTIEIPVFCIGSIVSNLIHKRPAFSNRKQVAGFIKNVIQVWGLAGKIISGNPWFYKML